ncbi:hypothetical protein [Endozoicomonas sp. 4G]|uniref:hypothetical protein n=1 Tax=Endozoicomonas sp. 4G TaxID=2872754 RepID=UPI002078AE66|nr:hypothetical protein [Endozoicomonas sp. 4G]
MKINVRIIILLLLCSLSSYSNSNELCFKWQLKHYGYLVLDGVVATSNQVSRSNAFTGFDDYSSEVDWSTRMNMFFYEFVIYEVASTTHVVFNQNAPDINVPEPFYSLLRGASDSLQHKFFTQYILKGQMTKAARHFAELLSCIFCPPFFFLYAMCKASSDSDYGEKVEALEAATPSRLPDHVSIAKRSLSRRTVNSNNDVFPSPSMETIGDNTHIVDLFMNSPEAQHWVIARLKQTNAVVVELIMPQLFNTALPALLGVQEQITEIDNEVIRPSHFVSINFSNGIKVQYHIKQLSDNEVKVLAIVVSGHGYTLTIADDDYDVVENQPSPDNSQLTAACDCNGACNCASSSVNTTDESDDQSDTSSLQSTPLIFPHTH